MFTFEFTINIIILLIIISLSVLIGYKFKRDTTIRRQVKIDQLEKEMLQNHAEILQLQKEYCVLEQKLKDLVKPVIPMKPGLREEEKKELQPEKAGGIKTFPTRSA